MSAPFVFLFLIGVAAIVWPLCFVGCGFAPVSTPVDDFYEYQNAVGNTAGLVSCWPLDDQGTTAFSLTNSIFDGTYNTTPAVGYDGTDFSDASPGTFTLNQPNIVAGDTGIQNSNAGQLSPCVLFNGGFVSVPWQAALAPPQFTLEAWVVPNWTATPANKAYRSVVASAASLSGTSTGFALLATPDNLWAAAIGIGSQDVFISPTNNQPIVQGSLYFLVMTYDGTTLTLWINPMDTTQPPDATQTISGYLPVPSPVPFFIGQGHPDAPTPLFPFNGFIQDVAFYNVVLDGKTIEGHYLNGLGLKVPGMP